MNKIKLNTDVLKLIVLFESLTHSKVKDCIPEEKLITYIVEENEAGKAIGKNGINVKRLGNMAKKNIRIIEYSSDLKQYTKNVIYPLKVSGIEEEEVEGKKIVTLTPIDSKTRGYLIGRAAENLRGYEALIKRYFEIDELKVV
ncbi:MAG: NusA-like transcription termination signal-binding factor [Candidatus Woesearchaeota archaeon]|jgi:N utilization substance protein A|nr:NusA-like transcription termination signal-binding factor [Candidatus Woesearchaeota archaeon]MDP7323869.1 NusA-like transcription termination signal-binding factor [Candidatus Woesearchaeota archaeon]MDP7458360.1 NusA-like transcription termination signal-binding factor [Candidatus Woesearchaeota archaeon]